MTKTKKIIIGVVAAAIVVAALILLLIYKGWLPSVGGDDNVAYVQKVSSLTGQTSTVDRYGGVIESQKAQTYKKDTSRDIEEVYVKIGDTVVVGSPLFKYDVRTSENNIASIKLDIEALNNEISYLQGQSNSTEIQLQISERQLEIKQKQADLARYEQEIANAEVRSEIAGIVKGVNASNDNDSADQAVVTITEIGEFRVKGKVSEQSISTISQGMPVIVRSRVDETQTWNGTISKIETEPATNQENEYGYYYSSGERSSSYPFYVSLEATVGLMLGQHVFIEPDYGQGSVTPKEGVWIDQSFVITEDEGNSFVWLSNNGRLAKRTVELGEMNMDDFTVEILSGLSLDDSIAWPDDTLKEGMKTKDISKAE